MLILSLYSEFAQQRDDDMTLREEITKARQKFYIESDTSQMGEEIELLIDRVDGIAELVNRLEIKLFNDHKEE